jgi:hypothetical protein
MHIHFGSSVVGIIVIIIITGGGGGGDGGVGGGGGGGGVFFVVYVRCCHSMAHRKISDQGNGPQLWSLPANISVVNMHLRIVDKRLSSRLVLGLPLTTLLHNESSRH